MFIISIVYISRGQEHINIVGNIFKELHSAGQIYTANHVCLADLTRASEKNMGGIWLELHG